ncbi:hypothetical protein J4573_18680 [Actinomadura barringtoniae]|uniref:Uncharacterized protein n=1 Tax=Actinomadura barringtoniae TaxID=1427535 RepID=A0A939T7B4_9ACTN|nr:hypothetical protein [Actinomadura barringtoniae]MBO2449137.1 hypothetical protein [Actinomadura barringtoniae]
MSRHGEKVGVLGAAFRCAECGEIAGVLRLTPAGQPVDMGPPLGRTTHEADGVSLDLFGGTSWHRLEGEAFGRLRALIETDAPDGPDALEIRRVHWELAPFLCRECGDVYCWTDWKPSVTFDDGFYDETRGTCPRGHRQTIDD